jgi:nicotinamide-nucleotide amidase
MKTVSVVSTGNELLYGKTADTNSGHICARLFPLDLKVLACMAVGDDVDGIERALRHCLAMSDLVIMTGGLGPTDDDNTIAALGRIFSFTVVTHGESLARMEKFFAKLGMPMSRGDLKMTEVPSTARVIENLNGLAPGLILGEGGKTVIALPGVPREMADMLERAVLPFITGECGARTRHSLAFRVVGMKESDINAAVVSLKPDERGLDWGITASEGVATVTMVGREGCGLDDASLMAEIRGLFGGRLLEGPAERPEEEILVLLKELKMTLACAESCTGGLVAKRLTDIPGSSDVFAGGVVAYSNDVKVRLLHVSAATLDAKGAVSAETAAEMAEGVRTALSTDIGLSVTGIAGPGGGSEAKPVGTVWFGLAHEGGVLTMTRTIAGDRERVRAFSSLVSLEMLREFLKEQKKISIV